MKIAIKWATLFFCQVVNDQNDIVITIDNGKDLVNLATCFGWVPKVPYEKANHHYFVQDAIVFLQTVKEMDWLEIKTEQV